MTRLIPLLAVLASPLAWGQQFRVMPAVIANRWDCSLATAKGWNDRGFDSEGWRRPDFSIPGRYPQWMEPEAQALYRFMWHPSGANTGKPVYFRRSLWLPGQIEGATLHACADDRFALYVNGRGVGQSKEAHQDSLFDLAGVLKSGANVVALQAMDVKAPAYGLLVVPEVTQRFPLRAQEWRCSTRTHRNWQEPGYCDRRWRLAAADQAPAIALRQMKPFACISVPGGMKDFSTAYFRRSLDLDGLPLEANIVTLGDDGYELYVNGTLVALEKRSDRAYIPHKTDVTRLLHPGRNLIAVKVTNDWGPGRMYCVPTVTVTF